MELHFTPLQIVFFDDARNPVKFPAERWTTSFDPKKCKLTFFTYYNGTHFERNYTLDSDVYALSITDRTKSTDVGRTFRRMALSGIATAFLVESGAMGGALMDLSVRGAEIKANIAAVILFEDFTICTVSGLESSFRELLKILPEVCTSKSRVLDARELLDKKNHMVEDGNRVIAELELKQRALVATWTTEKQKIETGETFEIRDRARAEIKSMERNLRELEYLKRAVEFDLFKPAIKVASAYSETKAGSSSGWSGVWLVVGVFVALACFARVISALRDLAVSSGNNAVTSQPWDDPVLSSSNAVISRQDKVSKGSNDAAASGNNAVSSQQESPVSRNGTTLFSSFCDPIPREVVGQWQAIGSQNNSEDDISISQSSRGRYQVQMTSFYQVSFESALVAGELIGPDAQTNCALHLCFRGDTLLRGFVGSCDWPPRYFRKMVQ